MKFGTLDGSWLRHQNVSERGHLNKADTKYREKLDCIKGGRHLIGVAKKRLDGTKFRTTLKTQCPKIKSEREGVEGGTN
jgi:hypothetical protein